MRLLAIFIIALLVTGCAATPKGQQGRAPRKNLFSREILDIGVVCSNVRQSIEFYTKAIGFTEVEGFDIDPQFGGDSGLSDNEPFHVHVLQLAAGPNATRLKLMQFPDKPGKLTDQAFIHSSYGFSYLTVFVTDMDASLERARQAGATILGKSPVIIGTGPDYLTLLRDPDGNLVELVGPRR